MNRDSESNKLKNEIHILFNTIAIQTTAEMAADKEAVGLSRVHMYESTR